MITCEKLAQEWGHDSQIARAGRLIRKNLESAVIWALVSLILGAVFALMGHVGAKYASSHHIEGVETSLHNLQMASAIIGGISVPFFIVISLARAKHLYHYKTSPLTNDDKNNFFKNEESHFAKLRILRDQLSAQIADVSQHPEKPCDALEIFNKIKQMPNSLAEERSEKNAHCGKPMLLMSIIATVAALISSIIFGVTFMGEAQSFLLKATWITWGALQGIYLLIITSAFLFNPEKSPWSQELINQEKLRVAAIDALLPA